MAWVVIVSIATGETGSVASTTIEETATAFVRELSEHRFAAAAARFDEEMNRRLPADKLEQTWTAMEAQVGALVATTDTRRRTIGPYPAVFVACAFERDTFDAKIVFDERGEKIGGLWFQSAAGDLPRLPEGVVEREVTVGGPDWPLPGTLTLPTTETDPQRRWPGVVLVHGSGPIDRDSTVGGCKPFRDLAWGLAARGMAVLRYDKRTLALKDRSRDLGAKLTVQEEVIDDALAALALLRSTDGVDPARVYLLGHSLGGLLAPRIAAQARRADLNVAGLILAAPTGRSPHQAIVGQVTYILGLDGGVSPDEQAQLDYLRRQADGVEALLQSDATPADDALLLGAPPAYWRSLRAGDAPGEAARLQLPMLILHGGRDYQVTAEDLAIWRSALGQIPGVAFEEFPSLNHLLIAGEGPSSPAEYQHSGRVDEKAIDVIAHWLR
jgi:alpha-beta hydrolase superfamily lysophospholipase